MRRMLWAGHAFYREIAIIERCPVDQKRAKRVTPEDLYQLLGHQEVFRDLDVKTLVLDLVKKQFSEEELLALFWKHLGDLDPEYIKGYVYRKFS